MKACACGCGQPAPVYRGAALRFVHGHNARGTGTGRSTVGGYPAISLPDHPRANDRGFVQEHVVIAERALGKALPPGVEVHHVNEDKKDNGRGNLVVCEDHAYHALLHVRARALRATGDANKRLCCRCQNYDSVSNLGQSGPRFYHHACNAAHVRAAKARRLLREFAARGITEEQVFGGRR